MDIKEIAGVLDTQGRLTHLPPKRRKKILALCYIAQQIPAEKQYTEREFNELLKTLHSFGDPATLRRELYDLYLVERTPQGSCYWLNPTRPTPEELLEKYCK